jgi:hypothetical protein
MTCNTDDDKPCVVCKNGGITGIALYVSRLEGMIPSSIGALTGLTTLFLFSNNITGSIPPSFADLKSLTKVQLSENQLTGTIPSVLAGLNSLTTLGLQNNQLTGSIPPAFANFKALTSLDVACNKLTGIVPALPFEQYTGDDGEGCFLDRPDYCTAPACNHFSCPLPANSNKCNNGIYGPGVHCK